MANKNIKNNSSTAAEFNRRLAAWVLLAAGLILVVAGVFNVTDRKYKWYKSFLEKTEQHLEVVIEGEYDPAIAIQYNDYIAKYTKLIADRKTAAKVLSAVGACSLAAGGVLMAVRKKEQ